MPDTLAAPDASHTNLAGALGVVVVGPPVSAGAEILAPEALAFVGGLVRKFRARRDELLARRARVQEALDAGEMPDLLAATKGIRDAEWSVAPIPSDLQDRRVEITGPTDRKMVINALNSGASTFMADFEDSTSPTWENVVTGQKNVKDAVDGTISFVAPETGKVYRLAERTAVLLVRPRGWHLPEAHLLVDGAPAPASLVDFGLFFFHNARALVAKGSGPYLYLPKLESHLEARLWNDVFVDAQEALGIPVGTIRATVLVETVLAAFEMDEILWELRAHAGGLNCGRWDYIFSFIKKFRSRPELVLPERAQVGMDRHFLASYVKLLVATCHRRGIHAMGGMAAQIPIKDDEEKNRAAIAKVVADKEREARAGHDGTWVAHPGLVSVAKSIFDVVMPQPNQIEFLREDVDVTAADLLSAPEGTITEKGLRQNVNVGILYLEAWLRGVGCVPLYDLMEDAATAEISRTQLWQWIRHGARLLDGRVVTPELYRAVKAEEMAKIRARLGEETWALGTAERAAALFDRLVLAKELADFLTLPAYEEILEAENATRSLPC